MVEPPGTAPGSAASIARCNLSPYPVETGTDAYRPNCAKEKGPAASATRPHANPVKNAYFFNASRISAKSSTSLGPEGAGGALGINLLACLTIKKMMKAKIRKLMTAVIKLP